MIRTPSGLVLAAAPLPLQRPPRRYRPLQAVSDFQFSNFSANFQPAWPGSSWESVMVRVTVTNTGGQAATHQLHVWSTNGDPPATVNLAAIASGFSQTVTLQPGESQNLTFGPGNYIFSPLYPATFWVEVADSPQVSNFAIASLAQA